MIDASAIVVRGLRKRYAGRAVVDGIDLDVPAGSIFALLGPNGAGKTTTVEILEGYRVADEGSVEVLGLDPARRGQQLHARIGIMLQAGGIYPQATPREVIRLFSRMFRQPLDEKSLLAAVGLTDVARSRYRVLSGGERQRLGLALAMIGRPELLLLDEPTAGMDPTAKAATRQLIVELRSAGATILITTHELADVELLADEIAILDRGRIVARGSAADLAGATQPMLRFRLGAPLKTQDREALGRAVGGAIEADGGLGRHVVSGLAPTPAAVAALSAWCAEHGLLVAEIRTTGATLEERYLELTGSAAAVRERASGGSV